MSDRKLLKKVRDGDKEALSDIIKQYYADIFRFCLYMIQNEEDSYDITQETFLKFMKYGTSYQRNNLKGYLLTIARNLCFDYQQRKKETGKNLRSYEAENETDVDQEWENLDRDASSAANRYRQYEGWEFKKRVKAAMFRKGYDLSLVDKWIKQNESEMQ